MVARSTMFMRSHVVSVRVLASVAALLGAVVALASCSAETPTPKPAPSPAATAPTTVPVLPHFNVDRVVDDIGHLAKEIGPRHATSAAYREAADWVEERFRDLGYEVTRMDVAAPAGNTWGVDVEAGNSPNVIARSTEFNIAEPHVVIGAHLDTVPVAPGAEDNASGVAVMLELARVIADDDRPVQFIAFGAEEPRGAGDDLHHFGSQTYVRSLDDAERSAITAMISLDRVGVEGPAVPICTGGRGTMRVRDELRDVARRLDVPHNVCADNRTSDHWSFERNDLPSARLGSIPYDGYHSARDVPEVVSSKQLDRVGAIMIGWLRSG